MQHQGMLEKRSTHRKIGVSYIVTFEITKISGFLYLLLKCQDSPVSTSSHNGILSGIAVVVSSISGVLDPFRS